MAGSSAGVTKGNAALLEGVNRAIAAAIEDGSMDQFVEEATTWLPAIPVFWWTADCRRLRLKYDRTAQFLPGCPGEELAASGGWGCWSGKEHIWVN